MKKTEAKKASVFLSGVRGETPLWGEWTGGPYFSSGGLFCRRKSIANGSRSQSCHWKWYSKEVRRAGWVGRA